jgi:hypothetical protein
MLDWTAAAGGEDLLASAPACAAYMQLLYTLQTLMQHSLGALSGCGDEGQVDGGLGDSGQLDLGLLSGLCKRDAAI